MSNPESPEILSLDELFAAARKSHHAEREREAKKHQRRAIKDVEVAPVTPQQLFLDPENWERKRGVALIHKPSDTLLGNFSEYVHRSVANCRKLVREAAPISVSTTEYVSGDWWLGQTRVTTKPPMWRYAREAIIHLHLSELRLHAPAASVKAFLAYGGIERVELACDTMFAPEGETEASLVFLPAGVDLLPVMSRDCKISLREVLAL